MEQEDSAIITLRRVETQVWSHIDQCYAPSTKEKTYPTITICHATSNITWTPNKEGKEVEFYVYNVVPGSGGKKIQWRRRDEVRYVLDLKTYKLEKKRGNKPQAHYPFELYQLL